MAIINKDQLRTDLNVAFPDNNSELITPAILRDYLLNFVDSNLSNEVGVVDSTPETSDQFVDTIVAVAGAGNITLSANNFYTDRFLTVLNASGGNITLFAPVGETIRSVASYTVLDRAYVLLVQNPNDLTDYAVIFDSSEGNFLQLTDTPSDYTGAAGQELVVNNAEDAIEFTPRPPQLIAFQAAGEDDTDDGDYLSFGSDTEGSKVNLACPVDGVIIRASIGRTDSDDTILQLRVNDAVEEEFFTTENQTVYAGLDVAVSAGDKIEVRVKSGENHIDEPVFTFLIALDDLQFAP